MRLQDEGDASASGGRSPRGGRSSAPRTAAGDSGRPRSAPRQGDRQGGTKRDPRNAPQAPANGAMAEALRRAGLVNDKGTQAGKQDRRPNRP
jgi:uncharacterized protein